MSDLVKRLRDPSTMRGWTEADALVQEAADRIEELERALALIAVAVRSEKVPREHVADTAEQALGFVVSAAPPASKTAPSAAEIAGPWR